MVDTNTSPYQTNFTVSIEAAEGVTTGISAYDRAHTILTAVRPDAGPQHIVQPGHVFPLSAQPGGVLARAGHTEAACDLAALAGLEPAGVLVEVLSEDGAMARRPELEAFAARHGLNIGTIADLIRYRLETEKTVERVHECEVDTPFGRFRLVAYRDHLARELHFALLRGVVDDGAAVLTRVHVRNALFDVLHIKRDDAGHGITDALQRIAAEGRGVVVVLAGEDGADDLLDRLRGVAPDARANTQWRRLGLGAQILADLGVRNLRVLGTPRKLIGLAGFGLEVAAYEEAL
jgi:3,4-dihydroxy 2-butanone 4-phosphate synthase/GTP cyclohydrolase II